MLKAAIVGCGKIAEAHAEVIKSFSSTAALVATCDKELLMARQLAERFGAKSFYDDLPNMLRKEHPNVVHITTPPQSHYELAKTCLEAGCHVFVEKPFTVNAEEARELIDLAISKNLKLTIGTDEQFSPVALEMRRLVKSGWLGGPPTHMDVYYCYDLGDERYARAFLKNRSHWLWRLPGQLIQNIIPHAVMKFCEFMADREVKVSAQGFTSKLLQNLGELELKDELRAIITDSSQTTAYLTFSTRIGPPLRQFLIFGPKNSLLLDQDHHALIKIPGKTYKSYLEKTIPLHNFARQYRQNMSHNIRLFLKREFQLKRGLYNLIDLFYLSITKNMPPPIPYKQILLCSSTTDDIISQIYPTKQINEVNKT
jgi:predicted dehydrogenase